MTELEDAERASFSGRLRTALIARGHSVSPSKFVSDFNLRADGLAVTIHAVRKWLLGESIPAQARLQIIANWLGVNAAWLRFGDAGNSTDMGCSNAAAVIDRQLASDIALLTPSNQRILRVVIEEMLRLENEAAGYSRAPDNRKGR